MSGKLRHIYEADSSTEQADVRDAIAALSADDLTEKSPVTAGASEMSIQMRDADDGVEVEIFTEGHPGEWSKTSEEAIKSAVQSVDGVGDLVESEGGYEG